MSEQYLLCNTCGASGTVERDGERFFVKAKCGPGDGMSGGGCFTGPFPTKGEAIVAWNVWPGYSCEAEPVVEPRCKGLCGDAECEENMAKSKVASLLVIIGKQSSEIADLKGEVKRLRSIIELLGADETLVSEEPEKSLKDGES